VSEVTISMTVKIAAFKTTQTIKAKLAEPAPLPTLSLIYMTKAECHVVKCINNLRRIDNNTGKLIKLDLAYPRR